MARSIPPAWRAPLLAGALASAVFLPWLGATGLWDPWESHYAEVARQMLVRHDWVHPWWESAWFFSKPALSLWLSAAAMGVAGVQQRALPPGSDPAPPVPSGLSVYTEWAVRLPGALLAVLACVLTAVAVGRLASRRAGLLAAAALATAPLFALMARQATTDVPFVALMTSGAMCFAVALWDDRAHRRAWAYAGYLLLGLATLAKGLLGFALPGAAFLAWFLLTGDWGRLGRAMLVERVRGLRVPVGPLLFLAVAAPWYLAMSFFAGRDDEGKTFAVRFWIHDHFKRVGVGVHTTTPGAGFDYFIEQLGYGLHPWVAALPGGLGLLAGIRPRDRDPASSLVLFAGLWLAIGWGAMTFSATRFHHYILPALPAAAVLCAVFLDRLLADGPEEHAVAILLGLLAFAAVGHGLWSQPKILTDLFVYNYDRPYPEREIAELHPGVALGPWTLSLAPRAAMAFLFTAGGAVILFGWLGRSSRAVVGALVAVALAFGTWVSWFHWRELSPHWSQRDVFWTWLAERRSPAEPVAAWYMNWRGETFYSTNLVRQIQDTGQLGEWAARSRRAWVVTERGRLQSLRSALPADLQTRIADRSSNKYYLVAVERGPPGSESPPR